MKLWESVFVSFLFVFSLTLTPVSQAAQNNAVVAKTTKTNSSYKNTPVKSSGTSKTSANSKSTANSKTTSKTSSASKSPSSKTAANNKSTNTKTAANSKSAPKKNVKVAASKSKTTTAKAKSSSTSRKFAAASTHRRGTSYAQLQGLNKSDPLGLSSAAVLAYDLRRNKVVYEKNSDVALPIASITKLMTALVIVESGVKLKEKFTVTSEDYVESSSTSKLRRGALVSRETALHLALMSSDNRAAHFLARTYPGGTRAFIRDMNNRATQLGMNNTVFYDSIGLNNGNRSSALDLSKLIAKASKYKLIKELSTTPEEIFTIDNQLVLSRSTNNLVADRKWQIGLQKTGLTTAAGYCMVMQTNINGRSVAMIFLDAPNKSARTRDAESLRKWLLSSSYLASN